MKKLMVALVLALTLVMGVTTVSSAAVSVYGQARWAMDWGVYWNGWYPGVGAAGQFAFNVFNAWTSRIGVRYMSDDKKFEARIELGVGSWFQQANAVTTREVWGRYNWGNGGGVLIGQTNSICLVSWTSNNLEGFPGQSGMLWLGRTGQIRFTFGLGSENYLLNLAIEQPLKGGNPWDTNWWLFIPPTVRNVYNYYTVPPLALSFNLNFGNVSVNPFVRWEWVQSRTVAAWRSYHAVDAGIGIRGNFGLVHFESGVAFAMNGASANWDKNGSVQTYLRLLNGSFITDTPGLPMFDNATGRMWNHYAILAHLNIGISNLNIGGGIQYAWRPGVWGTIGQWMDQALNTNIRNTLSYGVYINYTIPFGMFQFIPEVGWYDWGNDQVWNIRSSAIVFGLTTILSF